MERYCEPVLRSPYKTHCGATAPPGLENASGPNPTRTRILDRAFPKRVSRRDRRQHMAYRFRVNSLACAFMFDHVHSSLAYSLFWPGSLFLVLSLKGCHILCRGRRPRYPVKWNRKGLKGRHTNLHFVRSSRLPISSLMCQPSELLSSFWF
jgi:hypothetical protein